MENKEIKPKKEIKSNKEMKPKIVKDKEEFSTTSPKDSQKHSIQEEIENNYYKLIKSMDKIFEKEFGKMCPDFEPGCMQCKAHLVYNKFKQDLFEAFVK